MGLAWFESCVVVLSLLATLGVGLWVNRRGFESHLEYMLGSRRMSVLPIILSIAATYLSGSAMVSTCQEVYLYGTQLSLSAAVYAGLGMLSAWICLPVSYSVKSASTFEFFDRRFNRHIRKFASAIYTLETILHTAISQYVPAVTLSQTTGLPAFPIACVLSLVCLVYTASGGLKAVAWADSFEAVLFMFSCFCIALYGMILVGGPSEVWRRGVEGSRMELFNFHFALSERQNAPNVLAGSMFVILNNFWSPSFHQRVASMPTFGEARKVVIWSSLFAGVFMSLNHLTGIIVYAYFAGCDPILAKKGIETYATILPYFVNQVSKMLPGIEGLFLSGVVAAGLSTTTSCWNTVACTIYEDFFVPALGPNIKKSTTFRILTGIVITVSVVSTSLILIFQNTQSLLQITLSTRALTVSAFFVLYNAGIFLPWVNSKGILTGSLFAGALTTYIVLGALNARRNKLVVDLPKILTTAKCMVNGTHTMESLNITTSIGTTGLGMVTTSDPSVSRLFDMSIMLYSLPGAILGVVVSYLVSLLTGTTDLATVDREMIVPLMRWVLPRPVRERNTDTPLKEYVKVQQSDVRE